MAAARSDHAAQENDVSLIAPTSAEAQAEQPPAWEQIETGRFMPRRIRGSYRGGVLG